MLGTIDLALPAGLGLETSLSWVDRLRWLQELELVAASGSVRYAPWSVGGLASYGMGALSLVRIRPGLRAPSEVQPAFELGGGVQVWASHALAVRVDSRFVHIDDAPNFRRTVGGVTLRLP